jgi:ABC-type Fe3+-siderophore transport system permease subunit
MATTDSNNTSRGRTLEHTRRANTTGAHVATAGVVVFLIATFLDWVSTEGADSTSGSGYETDTTIPLVAFLGIGLVVGLQYAATRARGRQHRGLSLTTLAVGIAAVLLSLSYVIDVPGAFERGADLSTEIGAWIGLLGGIIWAVGAGLLAKEPEGDDDWNDHRTETHSAH